MKDGKSLRKTAASGAFKVGMQAQTIATLVSMTVHIEESVGPPAKRQSRKPGSRKDNIQVGSGLLVATSSVVNRRKLVMHTKIPTLNTAIKLNFVFRGSCRWLITGAGKNKMIKSVKIEKAAFVYHMIVKLMQVPGTVRSFASRKHTSGQLEPRVTR